MTRFFANDIELVLPNGFSFTEIEENPLFTSSGEYTLDFDLSLKNRNNAKALKHIDRLNNQTVLKDCPAIKVVNGRVSRGTLIVVSHTDSDAKCQFVSGNSEVVYFTGENKKIWEYDFGSETEITAAMAINSVKTPFWTNKFCCIPVKFSNVISNDYQLPSVVLDNSTNPATWRLNYSDGTFWKNIVLGNEIEFDDVKNITLHAYLLYYINLLPELLGYSTTENVLLTNARAQKEILINRTNSLKYSSALPDMTVKDFIAAIEYAYNVVFLFNGDSKTFSVINTQSYLENMELIEPVVLDDYTREPYDEAYRFDFTKISYNIESSGFLKYQKLAEDVVESCVGLDFSALSTLKNSLSNADKNLMKLYKITSTGKQYIFSDHPAENIYRTIVSGTSGLLVYVNKFRDYFLSEDKSVELQVVPCEMTVEIKKYSVTGQSGIIEFNFPFQLPIVSADLYVSSDQKILDAIESDINKIPRSDKIEVCLYNGTMRLPALGAVAPSYFFPIYPISFLDNMPEFWLTEEFITSNLTGNIELFEQWIMNHYSPVANITLRLNGSDGVIAQNYEFSNFIDTDYLYTFTIPYTRDMAINKQLYIQGQKYIILSIEKYVTAEGVEKKVLCKCFRLNS